MLKFLVEPPITVNMKSIPQTSSSVWAVLWRWLQKEKALRGKAFNDVLGIWDFAGFGVWNKAKIFFSISPDHR